MKREFIKLSNDIWFYISFLHGMVLNPLCILKSTITKWHIFTHDFARREYEYACCICYAKGEKTL